MYLNLLVRHGEYEFNCQSVHLLPENTTKEDYAEFYASTFYDDDNAYKDEFWYYFNGGEVAVKVSECKDVPESEVGILIKYL